MTIPTPLTQAEVEAAVVHALELVIENIQKEQTFQVRNGCLVREENRRYSYRFEIDPGASRALLDGSEVQIRATLLDEEILAQVVSLEDETLTLSVSQRLEARVLEAGEVVVDRARLYRKLKDALLGSKAAAGLDRILLNEVTGEDEEAGDTCLALLPETFTPDHDQRRAILRSLASRVTMILGPPGTGKTSVLAAIAFLHALSYPSRVLILSHTNIAIDNAIVRLVQMLRDAGQEGYLEDQQVIRFGIARLVELAGEAYKDVAMEQVVEGYLTQNQLEVERLQRHCTELRDRLPGQERRVKRKETQWRAQARQLELQIQAAEDALVRLEAGEAKRQSALKHELGLLQRQWSDQNKVVVAAEATLKELQSQWAALIQTYQNARATHTQQFQRWKQWQQWGVVRRWWEQLMTGTSATTIQEGLREKQEEVQRLKAEVTVLKVRGDNATATYTNAQAREQELADNITEAERQLQQVPAAYQAERTSLQRTCTHVHQQLEDGANTLQQLQEEVDRERRELGLTEEALAKMDQAREGEKRRAARKILENACVVGATLTTLYLNPLLLEQEWDVVIIDEGSMAPPPSVLVAARRATSHLVIIGDPLQLAPVCSFQHPEIKHWLGRDIFFHGNYTLEEARTGTHHSVLLSYQGRMTTAICDLIRYPVYKGALKDRLPARLTCGFGADPEYPVVLLDTSRVQASRAERPSGKRKSRANLYHTELMTWHVGQVIERLVSPPEEYIGVITPYTLQRDLLKERFAQSGFLPLCRVGTIHAFQGMEFDVVILDLVDAPGMRIAPFLLGGWGSDAMRMLNVAVSRARHKLYIVAHVDFIQHHAQTTMLQQVIGASKKQHHVIVRG